VFSKVLIANRGEIALRVARACRELGVRVVAVHSAEDRDSAVVRFAEESVQIGPAAARHSYLNIPAVIEAALRTGADAIHPGYGFLSEDADFAEVCQANGITFIGPPAAVLAKLGDKPTAREIMADAGLPTLSGSRSDGDQASQAAQLAAKVGYPLIIKAAAGGGGNGMTIVDGPMDFIDAYRSTRASAQALFGDGRVYLERFLPDARTLVVKFRDTLRRSVTCGFLGWIMWCAVVFFLVRPQTGVCGVGAASTVARARARDRVRDTGEVRPATRSAGGGDP
jgi:acetyl-CoA carboxylase biotin carboxylase subunit